MKLAFLWGKLKTLWIWIRPMLISRVGDFLCDPRVRALAVKAVEAAARCDLDGDGKHDHAVKDELTCHDDPIELYPRPACGLGGEGYSRRTARKPLAPLGRMWQAGQTRSSPVRAMGPWVRRCHACSPCARTEGLVRAPPQRHPPTR